MSAISKLRARYASLSVQAKAALWFMACSFMQRGITMITTPFFTRLMDLNEYGAVNTFTAWQQVLTLVVTLTLYKSLMNLYVQRKDWERVLSAVTSLSLLSSVVWLCVSLAFLDQLSGLLGMSRTLTMCMFVMLVGQGAIDCWSLHQRYLYKYKKMIVVTLLLTVLTAFVGLFNVIVIAPVAQSRVIPMAIVYFVIGIILYASMLKNGRCFFDKSAWVFALSFCIPLMPHYLSEFVLNSSDRLMINYMCGAGDVALYSVAGSVAGLIGLVTNSINSSYAPYTYQKIQSGQLQELAKTTNSIIIMVVAMLLVIEFFGYEIIWVFGGSKYLSSVALIVPLCFGAFFSYLFQMFARIQEYYVRRLAIVVPSVLCAILNIVLNLLLIPIAGYFVAAWTTAGSYLIFCLMHYVFYRRLCREKQTRIYDTKGIFRISVIYIALSAVVMAICINPVVKYSFFVIALIVVAVKRDVIAAKVKSVLATMK
jgi:O-antigen/teichoic acid export membrane protein